MRKYKLCKIIFLPIHSTKNKIIFSGFSSYFLVKCVCVSSFVFLQNSLRKITYLLHKFSTCFPIHSILKLKFHERISSEFYTTITTISPDNHTNTQTNFNNCSHLLISLCSIPLAHFQSSISPIPASIPCTVSKHFTSKKF